MDAVMDLPEIIPTGETRPEALWQTIMDDFVTGRCTLRELSLKHEIPYATVLSRSARQHWDDTKDERKRRAREALTTPPAEMEARARAQADLENRAGYLNQVTEYHATAGLLKREIDRAGEELNDAGLEPRDRAELRRTLIALHARWQEALSIPSVKPVELRTSGSERRVAAVPVG